MMVKSWRVKKDYERNIHWALQYLAIELLITTTYNWMKEIKMPGIPIVVLLKAIFKERN